jgi:hypothetical protein
MASNCGHFAFNWVLHFNTNDCSQKMVHWVMVLSNIKTHSLLDQELCINMQISVTEEDKHTNCVGKIYP